MCGPRIILRHIHTPFDDMVFDLGNNQFVFKVANGGVKIVLPTLISGAHIFEPKFSIFWVHSSRMKC